ncbi:hypothetical protein, conserved [Plasmodium vivax]|uniref:Uncharacterized protein n=1 Tax=Plasmodium vivax TaxID=5855 RepID=A0A1G4GX07_PLAVI|nr:hypothetical protein, conserved [Plasmodium vivax]
MKNNRKIIKRCSEKCKKYIQKLLYCENNLLSINNHRIFAANKKELKIYNNKFTKTFAFCFLNLHLNSTYNVATNVLKLIKVYHIFLLQIAVAMAQEDEATEGNVAISESPQGESQESSQKGGNAITQLCTQITKSEDFCTSEIMGTFGFFIISTIFSIITGLFYRVLEKKL